MSPLPRSLMASSLVCFALSLLLPGIQLKILGGASVFSGWQANALAILQMMEWVQGGFESTPGTPTQILLPGLAAIFNLVFLVGPLALVCRPANPFVRTGLLGAALIGLGLAVACVAAVPTMQPEIRVGYYFWLLAYVLLSGGLITSRRSLSIGK